MITERTIEEYISWAIGKRVDVKSISRLSGGVHDNILVRARIAGEDQKFLIRKVPSPESFGFARNDIYPYDLQLQFLALKDLETLPLRTPRVWGLDEKGEFLDTPAFLMEFIEGPTILEAVEQNPKDVVCRFAETILAMNQILPNQVPSVVKKRGEPSRHPFDMIGWIVHQIEDMKLPVFFERGLDLLRKEEPDHRPAPAFGNGDLGPMNYILTSTSSVAVVDWEFVGFSDPISEIMLLNVWPRGNPFLRRYNVGRLYCQLADLDESMLWWYRLGTALVGWIYADKDGDIEGMALNEQVAVAALTEQNG